MTICDLHTHSTASDGKYSPSEVVRKAYERGVKYLALTDHDTLSGIDSDIVVYMDNEFEGTVERFINIDK